MKTSNPLAVLAVFVAIGTITQAKAQVATSEGVVNPPNQGAVRQGFWSGVTNWTNVQPGQTNVFHRQDLWRQQNLGRTPDGQLIVTNTGDPRRTREWVRRMATNQFGAEAIGEGVLGNSVQGLPPGQQGFGTAIAPQGNQTAIGQQGFGTAIAPQGNQPAIGQQGFGTTMAPQANQPAIGQQGFGTSIMPQANPTGLQQQGLVRPQVPRTALDQSAWGTTMGAQWNAPGVGNQAWPPRVNQQIGTPAMGGAPGVGSGVNAGGGATGTGTGASGSGGAVGGGGGGGR